MTYIQTTITGNSAFGGYLSVDGGKSTAIEDGMVCELSSGKHHFEVHSTSDLERGMGKLAKSCCRRAGACSRSFLAVGRGLRSLFSPAEINAPVGFWRARRLGFRREQAPALRYSMKFLRGISARAASRASAGASPRHTIADLSNFNWSMSRPLRRMRIQNPDGGGCRFGISSKGDSPAFRFIVALPEGDVRFWLFLGVIFPVRVLLFSFRKCYNNAGCFSTGKTKQKEALIKSASAGADD